MPVLIEQPIFITSQAKQVQSQDYFVVMDQIDFSVFFSFFFEIYGRAFAVFHSPFLLPYWVLTIGWDIFPSRIWGKSNFLSLARLKIYFFNPILHDLLRKEKCSSLVPPMGSFYKTQWAMQGVKLTRLIWIFTSK